MDRPSLDSPMDPRPDGTGRVDVSSSPRWPHAVGIAAGLALIAVWVGWWTVSVRRDTLALGELTWVPALPFLAGDFRVHVRPRRPGAGGGRQRLSPPLRLRLRPLPVSADDRPLFRLGGPVPGPDGLADLAGRVGPDPGRGGDRGLPVASRPGDDPNPLVLGRRRDSLQHAGRVRAGARAGRHPDLARAPRRELAPGASRDRGRAGRRRLARGDRLDQVLPGGVDHGPPGVRPVVGGPRVRRGGRGDRALRSGRVLALGRQRGAAPGVLRADPEPHGPGDAAFAGRELEDAPVRAGVLNPGRDPRRGDRGPAAAPGGRAGGPERGEVERSPGVDLPVPALADGRGDVRDALRGQLQPRPARPGGVCRVGSSEFVARPPRDRPAGPLGAAVRPADRRRDPPVCQARRRVRDRRRPGRPGVGSVVGRGARDDLSADGARGRSGPDGRTP